MTTHTLTCKEEKATQAGALHGWRVDCSSCGFIGKSSMRCLAESMYSRGHKAYTTKKEG